MNNFIFRLFYGEIFIFFKIKTKRDKISDEFSSGLADPLILIDMFAGAMADITLSNDQRKSGIAII